MEQKNERSNIGTQATNNQTKCLRGTYTFQSGAAQTDKYSLDSDYKSMGKRVTAWLVGVLMALLVLPGFAQDTSQPLPTDDPSTVDTQSFFLDGIYGGVGVTAYGYRGALRQNPNDNVLKYVTAAQPSVHFGVDRRMGQYQQYTVDLRIEYNGISGQVSGTADAPFTFDAHLLSIETIGAYSLPYIQQDLLRVFAGGGLLVTMAPSFSENPPGGYTVNSDGSQIAGSLTGGLLIHDTFRVGVRLPTSSTLIFVSPDQTIHPTPDILGFVELTYRFGL